MSSAPTAGGVGRRVSRTAPYAFILPAAVLFVVFMLVPIAYTVFLSFRRTQAIGLGLGPNSREQVFAGWENYAATLTDPELLDSTVRVLGYGLILVPVMLGLALLFALLLDTPRVLLARFARISIFLPYAVPVIIASLLWGFFYLPSVSPVTAVAEALGLPAPDFLGLDNILVSVANIGVWGGVGFNMLVIYTSLRSIPQEVYEAARLDGCSEVQIALRVKIPMVMPSIILTSVFSIIATLQVFSEPKMLSPLTNSISTTWTPLMKVYRDAFIANDIYSAAATSVIIAVVTLVLSLGFLRLVNNRAFGGEQR
ncbi:carbohydrate ABC transporter permease [Allostreptomyces psammosilenae]|uniref:Multiple sugar transport system permease protein n=1 Tax=Allostreptomyces psammosilenae TaxID=1892865 RepID=A0A852ZXJ1_9ACTN|nr:sugar ABC transporter permease [Allostreptomyces psammosilenae]NYI06909.1 multiple sugar transport system permease protein [Allostreptomyces psammosilenae]